MKIRITANDPKYKEDGDISHLIGRIFDVKRVDKEGYYIPYGPSGLYLVRQGECELIRESGGTGE